MDFWRRTSLATVFCFSPSSLFSSLFSSFFFSSSLSRFSFRFWAASMDFWRRTSLATVFCFSSKICWCAFALNSFGGSPSILHSIEPLALLRQAEGGKDLCQVFLREVFNGGLGEPRPLLLAGQFHLLLRLLDCVFDRLPFLFYVLLLLFIFVLLAFLLVFFLVFFLLLFLLLVPFLFSLLAH